MKSGGIKKAYMLHATCFEASFKVEPSEVDQGPWGRVQVPHEEWVSSVS